MENYATLSIETHLFFARIMKEHALFLEAGFPCKDETWIKKADWFRQQFEEVLSEAVDISNGRVHHNILKSGELATQFTIPAEERTSRLTGVEIDSDITRRTMDLRHGNCRDWNRTLIFRVRRLNERVLRLLDGLIEFKESILKMVCEGRLFTANYPLLIKHIIREAKLYRLTIREIMQNRPLSHKSLCEAEKFWNQIMMEHALFIRGLLDPCEEALIDTADNFADQYKKLLETACEQDCRANEAMTGETLATTLKYRDFKAAGTDGILDLKISSIILPLLADHVLREANHYIRILESASGENNI